MRLHVMAPALPPALDGIGDYTARLTTELARRPDVQVTVLTAQGTNAAPLDSVEIASLWQAEEPASVRNAVAHVGGERPDWLLVQYNAFSYGRWGWNPYLPLALRRLRKQSPNTRLALMAHETFVPVINWKFALMTTWQRWQLNQLIEQSDVTFFSIDVWRERFAARFPRKRIEHLPVGSNMPRVDMAREEAKARLGFAPDTCVVGLFGTWHTPRLLALARQATETLCEAGFDAAVCYVGPKGEAVRAALGSLPNVSEGPLEGEEASRRFAAMDIYLAPFVDGVSTRRTSLMTALQHGIATVGTRGELTDNLLKQVDGQALLLADVDDEQAFCAHVLRLAHDAKLRKSVGAAGRERYDSTFDWPCIASKLLTTLASCSPAVGK